jgi:3-oxoacyl-[acyl-carrier protein] reductase
LINQGSQSGEYADLRNKVALVTGGSRGIGAATCLEFAASGMKVAVHGRDPDAIDRTVGVIAASGGVAVGIRGDVCSAVDLELARQAVESALGPVDVLATFAGGDVPALPLSELSEQQWRDVVDLNLTSSFLSLHTFLPGMLERGRGAVILMASATARVARPGVASAAYVAAKGGVMALCRQAAAESGPRGVRVNCVSPSIVLTEPALRKRTPEELDSLAETVPLRRLGMSQDVAAAAAFLASDASSWITGVTLDVAGGRVMP